MKPRKLTLTFVPSLVVILTAAENAKGSALMQSEVEAIVSDGAAALVLADVETALSLGKAIAFRSTAHVSDFLPMSKRDILKFEGCSKAWKRALADAGITLNDLSSVAAGKCG